MMKYVSVVAFVGLLCLAIVASAAEPKVKHQKTADGVEFGIWELNATRPAPTLFIFAGVIDQTLNSAYFRQCGNELAEQGYILVSVDIPCHGSQTGLGKPSGLGGWSVRAGKGDDFVAESNARMSKVLDHLIKTGVSDPQRIAACGTSRGGYIAYQFAARDKRVRCVAGFAPVTDLAALSEFRARTDHPLVKKLGIAQQADQFAGRPVWIVIGDQDARVSTHAAIDFAAKITAASIQKKVDSKVELHVMPEPGGHRTPKGSAKVAAEWVHRQLFPDSAKKHPATTQHDSPRSLLFIDDHHVLYRSGTKRVFHPAKLHGNNPVVREDQPWEMAIGWTSIVRHPKSGKYQLWYQAYAGGRDSRKSHKCVVCYAESDDGMTFTKRPLGIHDFAESRDDDAKKIKDTNIVLLGGGGYGDRYANSVLLEPHEQDASKRYKMLYTDFTKEADGREWPGFHAAFSPDGIHWTKATANPLNRTAYGGRGSQPPFEDEDVYLERWDKAKNFLRKSWKIPFSMSDAADVMVDPNRQAYVIYGKAWLQGPAGGLAWKHGMARVISQDFLTWSKPELLATPDDLDPPNTEFHTSPVFFHKGVYFCLNQILSARGEAIGAKADAMHIELMTSRDGTVWERPFRSQKFINSTQQSFSNGGIFTNSTPIVLDDEIRFYYGGYNSGAIGGGARLTDPSQQSGVGFASIPLDRFAGIRPVAISAQSTLKRPLENIGQVTLRPLSFDGVTSIEINADAGAGSIRVELLNDEGYRVRGFSKDDAVVIEGDSLKHEVAWKTQKVSDLAPGKYMLRLHLDNAEVFAVELE